MSNGWFKIGHATYDTERTGCTVILFDRTVPAIADVRGGAPGTRETTLLDPGRRGQVDAVVLSGGSAYGLRTADGVLQYLKEQDRGVATPAGRVPLVPAAIIYDLAEGMYHIPDGQDGYLAAQSATRDEWVTGRVGAGTGATVAKLDDLRVPGGLGIGTASAGSVEVTALVVVNAVGSIVNPENGRVIAGVEDTSQRVLARLSNRDLAPNNPYGNTTIGCVMVAAPARRDLLARCGIAAHNGLARCVVPAHTVLDGDTFFCVASGESNGERIDTLALTSATQLAVERAILSVFQTD